VRRHDISRELLRNWVKKRELLRTWVKKYEAGEFASDGPTRPDRRAYEAKIAGLERKVGQLTMELDLLKKGLTSARRARGASSSIMSGPKPAASEPGAGS
jgi:transposase